jgi:hypothetical protein
VPEQPRLLRAPDGVAVGIVAVAHAAHPLGRVRLAAAAPIRRGVQVVIVAVGGAFESLISREFMPAPHMQRWR